MLTRSKVVELVRLAALAPSSHNTQPWKFKIEEATSDDDDGTANNNNAARAVIRVFADGTRRLRLTDRDGRELLISVGASLANLRLAAEARSLVVDIEYTEVKDPLLLEEFEVAKLTLTSSSSSANGGGADKAAELCRQFERRVTWRKAFKGDAIPASVLDEIRHSVEREGAWLHDITTPESVHKTVADAIFDANDIQWSDPKWRAELAAWIRPSSSGDGLHIGPDLFNWVTTWAVRAFQFIGNSQGKGDRDLALAAPALFALGVDQNGPIQWLKAGQALQYGLLVATKHDVFASYFNQPLQVKEFSGIRFNDLIRRERGTLLLVFRLGMVDNPAAARATRSTRRPVEDIIIM